MHVWSAELPFLSAGNAQRNFEAGLRHVALRNWSACWLHALLQHGAEQRCFIAAGNA